MSSPSNSPSDDSPHKESLRYVGAHENDKRHGQGTYSWANGNKCAPPNERHSVITQPLTSVTLKVHRRMGKCQDVYKGFIYRRQVCSLYHQPLNSDEIPIRYFGE